MDERARDLDVGDCPHLRQDLSGILAREVAHIDRHRAPVRHLVERVAALDPPEVDRGAVEQLRGLARERKRLDRPKHIDRFQDCVVPEPWSRGVRRGAPDLDPHREHALRLDPDVQVRRLAGDREIPA
jgi:hypothetical protein